MNICIYICIPMYDYAHIRVLIPCVYIYICNITHIYIYIQLDRYRYNMYIHICTTMYVCVFLSTGAKRCPCKTPWASTARDVTAGDDNHLH